ncbi:hypothetical protein QBC34DRAFT_439766 [Podospora aff. communis PSN243]|uniref:Uncharacterized protein n=1 Tax=Podospora aff. communis PSN243 TaxID=3040156 RepID=A0AAV9GKF5_9PEZI|nr:hypothetical protein QBC34DRAFT_439766 [Podospora aff. communis PSN243]
MPTITTKTTFPLFPLLPGELQNLIWHHAATSSGLPSIHFLVRLPPRYPQWIDSDMLLIPDHESGALSLVHLSLSCRDARAAVLRRNQSQHGSKTILRISKFEAHKTMDLRLDLGEDLVVLGGASGKGMETEGVLDWGEWAHVVFSGGRRVGVRWPGAGAGARRGIGCFHADRERERGRDKGRAEVLPFCARCVAGVLRRFEDLRECFLILDGVEEGGGKATVLGEDEEMDVEAMEGLKVSERRMYRSYGRTYFSLGDVERRRELKGPVAALRAIRETLNVEPRFSYRPPWASSLCFGLLSWREGF